MSTRLHRVGALLVLACTLPLAQAQPSFHHPREQQRLQNYASDVLRNNRRDCAALRSVEQRHNGKIEAVCVSNNNRRLLRYQISPPREDRRHGGYRNQGARVELLSSAPMRDRDHPRDHRDPHRYR